jgi:hypothetical protein
MTALIVFGLSRGQKSIASGFRSGGHRYTPDHSDSQRVAGSISDPYEIPTDAEVVMDTTEVAAEKVPEKVYAYLEREGFVLRQKSAAASCN